MLRELHTTIHSHSTTLENRILIKLCACDISTLSAIEYRFQKDEYRLRMVITERQLSIVRNEVSERLTKL